MDCTGVQESSLSDIFREMLADVDALLATGPDVDATLRILRLIGSPSLSPAVIANLRLYSETLPKGHDSFTPEQRRLHFLWDAFDKLPLCLSVNFSIPFRRKLAGKLFKKCGPAFICEENVRFNFGQFIEIGENVFFNRNVFLDSKGGIFIGDSTALAEDVRIFTHSHSEASHIERTYKPVVLGSFVKVYCGAVILPGVTVGDEAIVASGALVSKDVPANTVVAGIPAKVIRERTSEGRHGDDLEHVWLY